MDLHIGTSGFSYPQWKGTFYPADLSTDEMLEYYAGKLGSVEINNTFYRMPKSAVVQSWEATVPESFRFVIKASRRISHFARLKDCAETVGYLDRAVRHLGPKLGAILIQLPPYLRRDDDRLRAFLEYWPEGLPLAIEFQHASWFEDDLIGELGQRDIALVGRDEDEGEGDRLELRSAASFGYLRLRRSTYSTDDLRAVLAALETRNWQHAFVFFKHEDDAGGVMAARELQAMAAVESGFRVTAEPPGKRFAPSSPQTRKSAAVDEKREGARSRRQPRSA